jgi:hypothetical protein
MNKVKPPYQYVDTPQKKAEQIKKTLDFIDKHYQEAVDGMDHSNWHKIFEDTLRTTYDIKTKTYKYKNPPKEYLSEKEKKKRLDYVNELYEVRKEYPLARNIYTTNIENQYLLTRSGFKYIFWDNIITGYYPNAKSKHGSLDKLKEEFDFHLLIVIAWFDLFYGIYPKKAKEFVNKTLARQKEFKNLQIIFRILVAQKDLADLKEVTTNRQLKKKIDEAYKELNDLKKTYS